MENLANSKKFYRFLEIVPGAIAWATLLMPIALAPFLPIPVAYFILMFNLYWFGKAMNLSRHLVVGYLYLKRNMRVDWLERIKKLSDLDGAISWYEKNSRNKYDREELNELKHLKYHNVKMGDWDDIHHLAVIAIYKEDISIVKSTIEALDKSNYPNDKFLIVLACEERAPEAKEYAAKLKEEFKNTFRYFDYFVHPKDLPDEVKGKGPNITYAAREFKKYFDQNEDISYDDLIVTNLDADHIVHKEYFGRVTFAYLICQKKSNITYQPVPLLFNNIWDTPAPNRIAAVGSSFWQIVEAMRPYRLRTFASHTQGFHTLIDTDFWSTDTIVEDGHQFWRTYFRYKGDHEMVALLVPIYQDAVLDRTYWLTYKGQYLQRRRWAWGTSDFPFIVVNFMKLKTVPFLEKFIQTFRHFGGLYSWATASFLIAGAWVPLLFNDAFQDTVLAHNVTTYAIFILRIAWVGIFINVWIYLLLLPPRPKRYGVSRHVGMVLQWALAPIVAIFLSSLPALDSQTRLMLGRYLEFWTTPKVRKA